MTRRSCRHCGADTGGPDFAECGHCALLKPAAWVKTSDGATGQIVTAKHSGGFIVQLAYGERFLRGDQLAIINPPTIDTPVPPAAPAPNASTPADMRSDPAPIVGTMPDPHGAMLSEVRADRTTWCESPAPDPDPLVAARRYLLSRPFDPRILEPQPR